MSNTTTFEIVEPKPYHVGQMIHRLRRSCHSLMLSIGQNPHRELRAAFQRSMYRRAWLVNGRLAGMGGVTGSMLSSGGYIWLAIAEEAMQHKIAMIREARRQLAVALDIFARVETKVLRGDLAAVRFARFMGFRPIGDGPHEIVMEIRREWLDRTVEKYSNVAPFFVFGLPRSRTKWMSEFLTADGWKCHHDSPLFLDSLDQFAAHFDSPMTGSVETAMAPAWRFIRQTFPEARFAVVRRPRRAVEGSADAVGLVFDDGYLEDQERYLDEISTLPGTVTLDWSELSTQEGAGRLYQHCLQAPMDPDRWALLDGQNIQIDLGRHFCAVADRWENIRAFFDEIQTRVTIQIEPFEALWRDGQSLFDLHREEAREVDEMPFDPDLETAQALDKLGWLVVATARTPKEMVGYIVFVLNRSLESRQVMLVQQSIFFVRKDMRGRLGIRLHGAGRKEAYSRGGRILMMRAGVRAEGPRLSALYERIGAKYMGKLYYLPMEA